MQLVQCPFTKKMCDAIGCLSCEFYPEELKYIELTEPDLHEEEEE